MNKLSRPIVAVFSILLPISAPRAQEAFAVRVAGVQVVNEIYPPKSPDDKNSFGGMDNLTPFNSFDAGVSIALMIEAPKGGILDIETDESKLEAFADDKGLTLYDAKETFGRKGFGAFAKASKDGKRGLVTVEGKIAPSAGATKATAKGKLAVRVGTKKTNHKVGKVALKKGTVFKAGTAEFTVGESKAEGDGISLTLETKTDIATLASVKFLGADGKEIESNRTMTGSMGGFGSRQYSVGYDLKTKQGQVSVEMEVWDDLKLTSVPFDVTVPISASK